MEQYKLDALLKAIWELIKEAARWALFAAISAFIAYISDHLVNLPIPPIFIGYITTFLRGVDIVVHNYGKDVGNSNATKGLSRF